MFTYRLVRGPGRDKVTARYREGVASKLIRMTAEDFERGFDGPPTADDVSVTNDGRRLDSKDAVIAWWAEVSVEVEQEEAARASGAGGRAT